MGRYYTLAEVNALVPEVQATFTSIMQLRSQLKPIYRRLEQAGAAPERSDFEVAAPGLSMDVIRDRAAFKGLIEALNESLARITDLGGSVKDLDLGLVDWLAEHQGRDILLCWRFGEREVGFWHDLDTGFAGRRPVEELLPAGARPRP